MEGQILKLKLQYFGHLMRREDSLKKMLGKCEGVLSAAEDLEPEGLTVAEENAEQSEIQTPVSPPESPPPVDRLRARLQGNT